MSKIPIGLSGLIFLLFVSTLAMPQPTAMANPAPLGKLIDVGGYRVHLYCVGTGSPTVVIVGAGLSFEWGLVQPEIAKVTQVCAYDHSGVAWSEPGPPDSCDLRINEIHSALQKTDIHGPYVLVGQSFGAEVARLYASKYPSAVSGIVIVDNAFFLPPSIKPPPESWTPPPPASRDPIYKKLPARDYELHEWATTLPSYNNALQAAFAASGACTAEVAENTRSRPDALGDMPLAVISRNVAADPLFGKMDMQIRSQIESAYDRLQSQLLSLSHNSKQFNAGDAGHMVHVERPDVVIAAIREVIQTSRSHGTLSHGLHDTAAERIKRAGDRSLIT